MSYNTIVEAPAKKVRRSSKNFHFFSNSSISGG